MIQFLATLLPEIAAWASGAAGGAAAGEAGAAGASAGMGGGFMGFLGRMLGSGATPFASDAELGAGMRQAKSIGDTIGGILAAHTQSQATSDQLGRKYQEDEAKYLYGDPSTDSRLAEEARKRAAYEAEIAKHRQEQAALQERIMATLHPEEAGFNAAGFAGAAAGAFAGYGGLSALFAGSNQNAAQPGLAGQLLQARDSFSGPLGWLANRLPGIQASRNAQQAVLQPLADLGVGQAEGHVLGEAAGFASRIGHTATNPMAIMRGELATEVSRLPGLLRDWSTELVESRRHLADYNGTLAITFADAQRREMVRGIESSGRTAGATAGLSDALQDLADQLQPIKDTVTIALSSAAELGVRGIAMIIAQLNQLLFVAKALAGPTPAALDKIIDLLGRRGDAKATLPILDFIRETKDRPIRPGVPRR